VTRVFVAFICVPFGVDFRTVVESFERNLRLPFTPSSGRRFRSFKINYAILTMGELVVGMISG
jgi:hypothetical protein